MAPKALRSVCYYTWEWQASITTDLGNCSYYVGSNVNIGFVVNDNWFIDNFKLKLEIEISQSSAFNSLNYSLSILLWVCCDFLVWLIYRVLLIQL